MLIHQNPLRSFDVYQKSGPKKQYISVVGYFDRYGIIKDYVVLDRSLTVDWARMIFQTISLKLFMGSLLSLEKFKRVIVRGNGFKSVVISTHNGYRAVIYEQTPAVKTDSQNSPSEYTLPLTPSEQAS